tara:strand:+ start:946 stop:1518 length:573 start_codon:yes stop_codon:yes gene_type:complete
VKFKDESKRLLIIDKTLDLVLLEGVAGLKMAKLAKEVGISPSTLYVYYKNKDALIISIFTDIIKEQTKISKKQLNTDLAYKIKLKTIWRQWLKFSVTNFKEMNFMEQVKQSPYLEKIPTQIITEKQGLSDTLFKVGKEQELLKNIDDEILTSIIGSMLKVSSELIIKNKISLNKKDTDMMFAFLWDAIKN